MSKYFDDEEKELAELYQQAIDIGLELDKKEEQKIRKMTAAAAENFYKKDKRINIRLSSKNLERIKYMSAKEGIPYQTLISSILHKYTTGQLHG